MVDNSLNRAIPISPLLKGGDSRHPQRLSAKGKKMLLSFKHDFIALAKGKTGDMPLFTANQQPSKPISRENFDKEFNRILIKASSQFEKHLTTHSFRATMITELLRHSPIDEVKQVIGHRSRSSTLE
jgi:integrase